jgi:ubiquitin carboxyl-terminal hydrolase 5/13
MSCHHLSFNNIDFNLHGKLIHKDECTKCFYTSVSTIQADEHGIDLCLKCYNGGCPEHAKLHSEMFGHPLVLNVKRTKRVKDAPQQANKITKLAIGKPGGADFSDEEWESVLSFKCSPCNMALETPGDLVSLFDSILLSNSALFQSSLSEWEMEYKPCVHTRTLEQSGSHIAEKSLATCDSCELRANLWLCLTCGKLGCGRKNYDGTGGNNHGVEHWRSSQHPLVVKLGTITPEGSASIHCYACDEEVVDEKLAEHLSRFGIYVKDQVKTEKTIAEMELESNLNLTLSKAVEEGRLLVSKYGPGFTGLQNLGNSCYLNSVMQVLFSLENWTNQYFLNAHLLECRERDVLNCYLCQTVKLANGLWSGEYSIQKFTNPVEIEPGKLTEPEEYQDGIRPQMFKSMIGKDHPEFKTSRQQDAFEFLQHFLTAGQRAEKAKGNLASFPGNMFDFKLVTKVKCSSCGRASYTSNNSNTVCVQIPIDHKQDSKELRVPWEPVLRTFSHSEEPTVCSACGENSVRRNYMFKTFPDVMVVMVQRFVCPDWVPTKLQCSIDVPVNPIDLGYLREVNEGEEPFPDQPASAPKLQFDPEAVSQIMAMGFSETQAKNALKAVGSSNPEMAVSWIFDNMDNPALNEPIVEESSSDIPEDLISSLEGMGFTRDQARRALKNTNNNLERAVDYLFSHSEDMEIEAPQESGEVDTNPAIYQLHGVVTHLGASVGSGHYVAHIRKEGEWVLYNDNKVAASSDPPLGMGYIYFFNRI